MKRLSVIAVLILMLMSGCKEQPVQENLAGKAAKTYYDHLVAGEYEEYLKGFANMDELPQQYQDQLLVNAKQFMAEQNELHQGIKEVRFVNAKTDSLQHYTNVFLVLCYGDATNEEVVVPMVLKNKQWLMK
jgi:hypothetical protein